MYSIKNLLVTKEELTIGETQKRIKLEDIKEIKIKRKRKNTFWLIKFYTYKYKFVLILNDLRTYEFHLHENKLSKAIKYKNEIDEIIHSVQQKI